MYAMAAVKRAVSPNIVLAIFADYIVRTNSAQELRSDCRIPDWLALLQVHLHLRQDRKSFGIAVHTAKNTDRTFIISAINRIIHCRL